MRTTEHSIEERSVRPKQHLPPRSLGDQQRTRAVHITLTLHESYTQLLVGTSKRRPPGDSRRALRRDITQGTKVPHDRPAEVPIRLDSGGHKGVTGVQMARMRPVLVPVTQSGSSATRLGGGGNTDWEARMDHGDIQLCGTLERGKGHFNASPHTLTANSCIANGRVTGLRTCTTASTGRDAAESFLSVVTLTRAAQAIATHGVVDITALDVTPTKANGGRDMWVGASSTKAEVATVEEAEIRVDQDEVQVGPPVPALETEQACAMRRGVPSTEKFCGEVLIECVQKGGTRDPANPDTGRSEGAGGRARGSDGCSEGWL
jgi:hypothetical protein